jgi:hypothetical protein
MSLVAICERLLHQHQNSQYRQTLNAAILLIDHYAQQEKENLCRSPRLVPLCWCVGDEGSSGIIFPSFFFFFFLWLIRFLSQALGNRGSALTLCLFWLEVGTVPGSSGWLMKYILEKPFHFSECI